MNSPGRDARKVPTWCYQCVAGPDLLKVKVERGVATEVEPNFDAADIHPGCGRVCVKAYGLIQKTYNPDRVLTPMRRTNPKKGRGEDPGFVPVSWEEALTEIASRLNEIRATGLVDESGYPRVAASFGGGGTPQHYMGTLPAFLSAWGSVDFGIGSGQGVKCYHSEHLYGELWHRAFIVTPDTPRTRYLVSFGSNIEASGGVAGIWRHAEARVRGLKRVQVEPHLSVTGGCSAEWIPIRPKTDAAFLFAMIHVLLHEHRRERLDTDFLSDRTSAPYLVGPNGYYLRDPGSRKPLVWDPATGSTVAFDSLAPGARPALSGTYEASGLECGPDGMSWEHRDVPARPALDHLVSHVEDDTPEWAGQICDVPAERIRKVANEFLDHAMVGETIEIENRTLPFRPVAITLGKTVNNGWGGYECCWARTLLACLVGALEVPGGTIGTTVRLNKPMSDRLESVRPGADGLMDYPFNSTRPDDWESRPSIRNAYRTLVPLAANSPWSQALGPTHLAWMFLDGTPPPLPPVTPPDVWFVYRTNPAISNWDTEGVTDKIARFPFVVSFAYTLDETNHMADILLPERTDLESDQLIRIGATKYVEQFWDHEGFALRQAIVPGPGETRDMTDIATELARRTGLLEAYNEAINRGAAGVKLRGPGYDHTLPVSELHEATTIWDRICRSASAEISDGREHDGLAWYREHGFKVRSFPILNWYLLPTLEERKLRFEMPYQERLKRIGAELANRMHENGIDWWDDQLAEYQALPRWKDFPALWQPDAATEGTDPSYDFWLLTARSMQYAWGSNAGLQLMKEMSDNVAGHGGVVINTGRARELGIGEGDLVEIRSPLRATSGRAILRQGIRPDTLLMIGQFDHWKTPFAKDLHAPSMNTVTPMSLKLTDATGSGADLVRVALVRAGGAP